MLPEEALGRATTVLANLTDGMTVIDLGALADTSRLARIPRTAPHRLVARHRFGLHDDPWEQLDLERIRTAGETLSRRVIGQPAAVRAVTDVLVNARSGLDFGAGGDRAGDRPRASSSSSARPGTGKTELAKALAELVFDDETALRRFDMSEYSQEHTSERLTGSPPGFVGHEQLAELREVLSAAARTPQEQESVTAVVAAEEAAARGDETGTNRHLRTAGRWALETAQQLVLTTAAAAIRSGLGG